jgi:magnesium and cobalt transporter
MSSFFKNILKFVPNKRDASARKAIHDILEEPEAEGPSLDNEERLLMKNILHLRDETVADIMAPRVDIVAVPQDMERNALLDYIAREPFTRLVVYGKNLDDLKGFIHVKDVISMIGGENKNISDILQSPMIVVSSLPVLDLLVMMRDSRIPMAVVVDEFGGVDGLVTAWDITKEIFGDLEEPPAQELAPMLIPLKDGSYEADARLPITSFAEHFNVEVEKSITHDDAIVTLGGLIAFIAGRVPVRKEVISYENSIEFVITEANPRRIEKVKIISNKKTSEGYDSQK